MLAYGTRTARRLLAVLVIGLTFAACGDDPTEPEIPSISGSWAGETSGGGYSVIMTLSGDANGQVSGTGSDEFTGGTSEITVTGLYSYPIVSLVIASEGYNDINFSGEISADGTRIIGQLNGSGFNNAAITLTRQ